MPGVSEIRHEDAAPRHAVRSTFRGVGRKGTLVAGLHSGKGMDSNRLLHELAEQYPLSLQSHVRRVVVSGPDEPLRNLAAAVIRGDAHRVVETRDDASLLEHVRSALHDPVRGRFDVVFRDARRDPKAALALLACLRRLDRSLPVVLLVKRPGEIFRRNAHRLGALLLEAPIESKRVLTVVAALGLPTAYRRLRAA